MLHAEPGLGFPLEALEEPVVRQQVWMHDLERHGSVFAVGQVDGAHGAGTEQADHSVGSQLRRCLGQAHVSVERLGSRMARAMSLRARRYR